MERVLKAPVLTGASAPAPHPTPTPGEAEAGGQGGADGQSSHCKAGLGRSRGLSWALAGLLLPEPGQPRSLHTHSRGPRSGSVQALPAPTAQQRHSGARGSGSWDRTRNQPQHGRSGRGRPPWPRVGCAAWGRPRPGLPSPKRKQVSPQGTTSQLKALTLGIASRACWEASRPTKACRVRKHPSGSRWD